MKRSPVPARISIVTVLVLSSAGLIGCQTQPDRDLGDSLDDRSLGLAQPDELTEPTEPFGLSPLDFVGRWVGVAEEPLALGGVRETYVFPSGSSQFSLELVAREVETGAVVDGTITFGNGAPPPPLDPALGHPSDVDYGQLDYFRRSAVGAAHYDGPLPPYEGYPYSLRETLDTDAREYDDQNNPIFADGLLPLHFNTTELVAPWCELQTPQPSLAGQEFSCVKGNTSTVGAAGECLVSFSALTPELEAAVLARGVSLGAEQVDCNKYFLCASEICACNDRGCYYNGFRPQPEGGLLLRRDGDTLIGVFSDAAFLNARQLPVPLGSVRFTRVED